MTKYNFAEDEKFHESGGIGRLCYMVADVFQA